MDDPIQAAILKVQSRKKLDAISARITAASQRAVTGRVEDLFKNYNPDPRFSTDPIPPSDELREGGYRPEEVNPQGDVAVARVLQEQRKTTEQAEPKMPVAMPPPVEADLARFGLQRKPGPVSFESAPTVERSPNPAQERKKKFYEESVGKAASAAFGDVLPERAAKVLYQGARAIQDSNPFSTPLEEMLRPNVAAPGSHTETAALAGDVGRIRQEVQAEVDAQKAQNGIQGEAPGEREAVEAEVASRAAKSLDLQRKKYETKQRTFEQDVAGVTGAEAAMRSGDALQQAAHSGAGFAQFMLNLAATKDLTGGVLRDPSAMGAVEAVIPALKEAQGGAEAQGSPLERFGEGYATGAVLHGASTATRAGLERLAPEGNAALRVGKEAVTQAVPAAGLGAYNAPDGEKARAAGVDAALMAGLTALTGGKAAIFGKLRGAEPIEPGVSTVALQPKAVGGEPEMRGKTVVEINGNRTVTSSERPQVKMHETLSALEQGVLETVASKPEAARALADQYGQTVATVQKAASKVMARKAAASSPDPSSVELEKAKLSGPRSIAQIQREDKVGYVEAAARKANEEIASKAATVPADREAKLMYSGVPIKELGESVKAIRNVAHDLLFTTRPRFFDTMQRDPAAARFAVEHVAAPDHSKTTGKLWFDTLSRIAKEGGREGAVGDFVKLIGHEEQARAIDARNKKIVAEHTAKHGRTDVLLTKAERDSLTKAKRALKFPARKSEAEIEAAKKVVDDLGPRRAVYDKMRFRERDALRKAMGGHNIPRIEAKERDRLMKDPVIQKMLAYYEGDVLSEINSLTPGANIKSRRDTRYYMQLRPLNEEAHREYLKRGLSAVQTRQQASVPMKYRERTARAAKMASGKAFAYGADLRDILENMHADRWSAVTRNNLVRYVKQYDVSKGGTLKKHPTKTMYAGKEEPVVALKLGDEKAKHFVTKGPDGKPGIGKKVTETGWVQVPKPLADLYNEVVGIRNRSTGRGEDIGNKAHSLLVGLQLATPAEAIWHANSLYSLLSTVLGKDHQFLVRFGGDPTRFVAAMADVYNLHGPDVIADYKQLSRLGGLRGEGLGTDSGKPKSILGEAAEHTLGRMRKYVFDTPDLSKKGSAGVETKSRLILFRTLKRLGVSPTEAAFVTNNKFGTYVRELQPFLARSFLRYFDPFINFGIAKIKAGANKMIGRGPTGFDPKQVPELLFNTWVMTPAIMAVAQKAVDPEHRWPWEIPGVPFGYLRISKDEKGTVDLPFARIMANTWWRSMRHSGLSGVVESYLDGKSDAVDLASGWMRAGTNAALGRLGGIPRAMYTTATGSIPYVGKSGQSMQVVPTTGETLGDQAWANLKWTASHFWAPLGEAGSVFGEGGKYPQSDSQSQQVMRTVLGVLGFLPRYGPTEDQARTGSFRGAKGRQFEVVRGIVSDARRKFGPEDPDAAFDWMEEQIADRLPKMDEDERDRLMAGARMDYIRYNANTMKYLEQMDESDEN